MVGAGDFQSRGCDYDGQALESVVERLMTAHNRGDLAGVGEVYAEDAEVLSYSGEAIEAKGEIRENMRATFDTYRVEIEAHFTDRRIFGERGFVLGYTQGRLIPKAEAEPKEIDDSFVVLLLCEDGEWHITHTMWGAPPDIPLLARIGVPGLVVVVLVLVVLAVLAGRSTLRAAVD